MTDKPYKDAADTQKILELARANGFSWSIIEGNESALIRFYQAARDEGRNEAFEEVAVWCDCKTIVRYVDVKGEQEISLWGVGKLIRSMKSKADK